MVLGFSKEERQERRNERLADQAAERLARQKRRAGRRRGIVDRAENEGYKEGKEGKKGGVLGFLEGAAKTGKKHIEIGPKNDGRDFSLFGGHGDKNGPAEIGFNADHLGLGSTSGKRKKRDLYSELGL